MSEFTCNQGHIVPSRFRTCPVCGEPVTSMDGQMKLIPPDIRPYRIEEEMLTEDEVQELMLKGGH